MFKHIVKGGKWIDALQEVAEAHRGSTIVKVRTFMPKFNYKAKPWANDAQVPVIRRTFILR